MSKPIKLVLSGSGIKFPLFIGAIKRLEEEGYKIVGAAGTSGGSLVAAGIACGYRSSETLLDLTQELAPAIAKQFKPSIITFLQKLGLFKAAGLYNLLKKKLTGKMKNVVIPLKIVTTDLDATTHSDISRVWSSEQDPGEEIWRLVAASMAVPGLFPPVMIGGHEHVDGGWVKNFPVDVWEDSSNVIALSATGNKISKRSKIPMWKIGTRIFHYVMRLVQLNIAANSSEDEDDAKMVTIVRLSTPVGSFDFDLTEEIITAMYFDGYQSMDEYIRQHKDRLP